MGFIGGGLWKWQTGKPAPLVGVVWVGAALVAMASLRVVPSQALFAFGLLGLAGFVSSMADYLAQPAKVVGQVFPEPFG